jgi:hypothetical protein
MSELYLHSYTVLPDGTLVRIAIIHAFIASLGKRAQRLLQLAHVLFESFDVGEGFFAISADLTWRYRNSLSTPFGISPQSLFQIIHCLWRPIAFRYGQSVIHC